MAKKIKIKLIEDFHVKGQIKNVDLKNILNNNIYYSLKRKNNIV